MNRLRVQVEHMVWLGCVFKEEHMVWTSYVFQINTWYV